MLEIIAGPNAIHENVLTPKLPKQVKRESKAIIEDAKKCRLMMRGTLRLEVQLGSLAPEVKLIVCEKLAVSEILGGIYATALWKPSTRGENTWY